MMPTLRNSKGEEFPVSDVDAVNMTKADSTLTIVGDVATSAGAGNAPIAQSAESATERAGVAPATAQERSSYSHKLAIKDDSSAAGALVRHVAGAASFGLTDHLVNENTLEADQAWHPIASGIGTGIGLVAPMLFGDEAGIAGAIAKDGVATERVAGSLGSKFLYGGEVAKGAELEAGLAKAGKGIDSLKAAAHVPEDLAGMDAAGLRAARDAEVESLATGHAADRVAAKSAAVDEMTAYQAQFKEANPHLVTSEGPASAEFAKSSKVLRNAMDDVEGLRENPASLLKPLRKQGQAIEKTIAEREAIAGKLEAVNKKIATDLGEDLQTLPDTATHVELSGKAARRYADHAGIKYSSKAGPLSVARDDAQAFVEAINSGEVTGASQKALGDLGGLLEANRGLQASIKGSIAPALGRTELTSGRLTAIDAARDALATPQAKSMLESMVGGSVMGHVAGAFSGLPIIGPMLGAKAGQIAGDLVFGRMGKTLAAGAERTKGAVDAFLNVGRNVVSSPVLASQTLARVAYAATGGSEKATSLPAAFKARTDEIKSQTAYGPDGKPEMRPEARDAMSARLAPIRAHSPILADRIETLAAKRIEYLSSIIPRRPDINGMQLGPDNWKPSDLQIRSFARSMAAAEDPHGVEERLASGQVTPEDADAYKAVYPERFAALQQSIMMELPRLSKALPYARRLSLSIFSGIAVDPSLDPRILKVLQAQYIAEEGTEGGTQAPKPAPAFGSIKSDPSTSAQRREAGIA